MIFFILILLLIGCEKNKPVEKEDPSIPIQAETPTLSDVRLYLELSGSLRPWTSVELYPQVEGKLEAIFIQEGDFVKAGTPLFQMDQAPLLLKKKEVEAQITIDQAAYLAIEKKLTRFSQLENKGLIAETEWDKQKTELEKTAGLLELDHVRLEKAALDLERCTIFSPIDGRVGKIDTAKGQLISSKQPLATVLQLDPLLVEMGLTEKEFEQLEKNNPFIVQKDHKEYVGEITFVDNHFDPKTGLILVKGKISNTGFSLRPGQLVQIKIPTVVKKDVFTIPQKAIKRKADGAYVYLVSSDERAVLQPVRLGDSLGKEIIVLEGLNQKDKVVVEGLIRLYPGVKVKR